MIASCHADAITFENTNWKIIYGLYKSLLEIKLSPVIEMNMAIALAYMDSFQSGLTALKKIKGLEQSHWYHSALGHLNFEIGNKEEASRCFKNALNLTNSNADKQLLEQKILHCLNSADGV
jgi:RNA polymerase sigma-70 factor, ECF subfamily